MSPLSTPKTTIDEAFLETLKQKMQNEKEIDIQKIFSIFPDANPKTITWRLYKLVQQGKLYKTGRGMYSTKRNADHTSPGYEYLQKKSKEIYDIISEYGYPFYISGLDSLVGELLHLPERFITLLVAEKGAEQELDDVLSRRGYFVRQERDRDNYSNKNINEKIDVLILSGKDFSLSSEGIAIKEKGFVDLYYVVTRMDYAISIAELSRVYGNLQRNESITNYKLRQAAKDRGIITEIDWLINLRKVNKKVIEFMSYQGLE